MDSGPRECGRECGGDCHPTERDDLDGIDSRDGDACSEVWCGDAVLADVSREAAPAEEGQKQSLLRASRHVDSYFQFAKGVGVTPLTARSVQGRWLGGHEGQVKRGGDRQGNMEEGLHGRLHLSLGGETKEKGTPTRVLFEGAVDQRNAPTAHRYEVCIMLGSSCVRLCLVSVCAFTCSCACVRA
jgi:hypothetical protein